MKTYRVILDVTLKDDEKHPKEWIGNAVSEYLSPGESVRVVTIVEPELMVGKERHHDENYLCTLENGRDVYRGDQVYRIELQEFAIADSIYVDSDGDRFLCFEPYGNAWIDGPLNGTQRIR